MTLINCTPFIASLVLESWNSNTGISWYDISNKSPNVQLGEENLKTENFVFGGAGHSALSTTTNTTGITYAETEVTLVGGAGGSHVGIVPDTWDVNNLTFVTLVGRHFYGVDQSGHAYENGVQVPAYIGGGLGGTISLVYNAVAKTLEIWKDGTPSALPPLNVGPGNYKIYSDPGANNNWSHRTNFGGTSFVHSALSVVSFSTLSSQYKLDETSGTTITDSVGSINGTTSGSPTLNQPPALLTGTSIAFDGVDDYIDLGVGSFNFERTDSFSVSFWIKTSSASSSDLIGNLDSADNAKGWAVSMTGAGQLIFFMINNFGAGNYFSISNSEAVNDNSWHHIAVVYNGSSEAGGAVIHIDAGAGPGINSFNQDNLSATSASGNNLTIGARDLGASFRLTGNLDEVRIYNGVLNTDEIAVLATP